MRMMVLTALMLAVPAVSVHAQADHKAHPAQKAKMTRGDNAMAERMIATWPARPKLGARQMMAKYGAPQEATRERLVWHNQGPFKRITVFNLETPHDFPMPHVDFMEHTITYNVPLDKMEDLIEFDGSSTINRTVGELSARCDLEGHNVLTLNLDHDIVTGKKSVKEAREAFGQNIDQDVKGMHPPYVMALQFQPHDMKTAAFADTPVIPGSPLRAAVAPAADGPAQMKDAVALASVIAIDLNQVNAGAQAGQEQLSAPVMAYAKKLHEEHGHHMVATMKLGEEIDVTPLITPAVANMQIKGADALAAIIPMDGMAFERAFLSMMVMGHTEVLAVLDNQLIPSAANPELKKHLMATRTA
ncbi:MAG: DUF4142 domain-containing protein, partial [Gemmatimonadales bacterium]|nr:DUF4142 domain-containing protein [Gemmatimonadales bacterium]